MTTRKDKPMPQEEPKTPAELAEIIRQTMRETGLDPAEKD